MKEYPILFKKEMREAIERGKKTQTRRLSGRWDKVQAGDLLWVKAGLFQKKVDTKLWLSKSILPR